MAVVPWLFMGPGPSVSGREDSGSRRIRIRIHQRNFELTEETSSPPKILRAVFKNPQDRPWRT